MSKTFTDQLPHCAGSERLRITPIPYHDDALVDTVSEALVDVGQSIGLSLRQQALAAE
jgi:5-aminolevulinate synthase